MIYAYTYNQQQRNKKARHMLGNIHPSMKIKESVNKSKMYRLWQQFPFIPQQHFFEHDV